MGHFQVSLLPFWFGETDRWRDVWLYVFILIGRKKNCEARLRCCSQYIKWNVSLALNIGPWLKQESCWGLMMMEDQVRLCGVAGTGAPCSAVEPGRSEDALGAAKQPSRFQKGKNPWGDFGFIFLPIDWDFQKFLQRAWMCNLQLCMDNLHKDLPRFFLDKWLNDQIFKIAENSTPYNV